MIEEEILAVVVSYNGLAKTVSTVRALEGRVGHILVVDNGSDELSIRLLNELVTTDVSLMTLPENRGIGHALNVGVKAAQQMGRKWVLTMDQDSIISPRLINEYCATLRKHPNLVCLTPSISYHGEARFEKHGPVGYAITSGNLVKTEIFGEVGLYNEDMFIDGVDFDFCMRLRLAGFVIYRVNAGMLHELGEKYEGKSFLRRFYTQHSPVRRYYMYRNYLYLTKKYFAHFPGFVIKMTVAHLMLLMLIPLYDRKPIESFQLIARAVRDYFLGRFGRYPEG